jgi:hypothetical protein
MSYGTIKVDTITFTDGGVDKSVSVSGLTQNPTITGDLTVTGTISGDIIEAGTSVSGVTILGTSGTFTTLTGTTTTGTTATFTSGSFTTLTGTTTSGTTANFVSGVFSTSVSGATVQGTAGDFTTITGGVTTITSGVFALGTGALPSISFSSDPNTGIYSPGADQVAISTNGAGALFIDSSGNVGVGAAPSTRKFRVKDSLNTVLAIEGASTGTSNIFFSDPDDEDVCYLNYNHVTNALSAYVNASASPALVIDSSNRVGLGTSSPSTFGAQLAVIGGSVHADRNIGSGSAQVQLSMGASSGSNFGQIGNTGTRWSLGYGTTANTIGTEVLVWNSSGNVGIGTSSPSAKLDVWPASASDAVLRGNSGVSSQIPAFEFRGYNTDSTNGGLDIRTNLNGTFTDKVRITNDGLVGIGTTSPATPLHVNGNITVSSGSGIYLGAGAEQYITSTGSNNATSLVFQHWTGAYTESARIDSSGRLLVGTSSTSAVCTALLQNRSDNGGPGTLYLSTTTTSPTSAEAFGRIIWTDSGHSPAVQIEGGRDGGTWTSGSSQPSKLVFSTTADGASSPTEAMRISSGQDVYIGGTVINPGIGNTDVGVMIRGIAGGNGNYIAASRNGGSCLFLSRTANDGNIVDIIQDGVTEGTISISGTTVSYNGAHLSRWSQLPGDTERTEILRGTVLSNIDEMCAWGEEDNEQLNRMKVSDVEGDPNVSGVFQGWDDDDDTYTDDFYCAMTGDFIIRIAEGVTVQRGDLLMSAGDGTAKPQGDDIVRSKTVAKVTSTHVTCTYDDGSYCVPCVLMAC